MAAGRKRSRYRDAMERAHPEHAALIKALLRDYRRRMEAGERVGCSICGKPITVPTTEKTAPKLVRLASLSIDHVRPLDLNDPWSLDRSNLRPAHLGCNRRRGRTVAAAPTPQPTENTRF